MPNSFSIPMFDPSGQLRWIPNDKIDSAVKANAQPAVLVTDPTGTRRWIPHSAVPQAIAHKGKMVSPADTAAAVQQWNESQEPSAASRLVSSVEAPIVSTAKSLLDWAPTPEEKKEGFTRPIDYALRVPERFLEGQRNQVTEAEELEKQGRSSEASAHRLGSKIPLVGPWIADATQKYYDQLSKGDVAGALGTLIGNAALGFGPEVGADSLESLTRSIPETTRATLKETSGISPVDMRTVAKKTLEDNAKAAEHNRQVQALHQEESTRVQEGNQALEHTLELRRQKEAELKQETDAYRAREEATDNQAKKAENLAWNNWRAKMQDATIDGGEIAKPLQKLRQNSPEVDRVLHQLEPHGDEVPQESPYARLRNQTAQANFGGNYEALSPLKQSTVDTILRQAGESPEPIDFDPTPGQPISVERVQRAYSILQRYIRSGRFEGPLLGEMKQVASVLRRAVTDASEQRGAADELDTARAETIRYHKAFGRERTEPRTVRTEREKSANPDEVARLQEEERLRAVSEYNPAVAESQRRVQVAHEALEKIPSEDSLRKSIQQIPRPPSVGDLRPQHRLADEAQTLSPEKLKAEHKEAILEKGTKLTHSTKGKVTSLLAGGGLSTWGLAEALRGSPEYGAALIASGAIVGFGQRALGQLLSNPEIADWLANPTPKEIEVVRKMPPDQQAAFGENLESLLKQAKSEGVKVDPRWTVIVTGALMGMSASRSRTKTATPIHRAVNAEGHRIVSTDGVNWKDVLTGEPVTGAEAGAEAGTDPRTGATVAH